MKITLIAGARPNFMKIAPIIEAIEKAADNGKDISYRPGPEKTDGRGVEARWHSGKVGWEGGGADCGEIIGRLVTIDKEKNMPCEKWVFVAFCSIKLK